MFRALRRPAVLSPVLLAVSSPALSQQPPQETPKLTSRTDLVLVPVIVSDRAGKLVPGLQKNAFRLEENGKAQDVAIFEEITTEKPGTSATPKKADGYSNYLLQDQRPWRMTVVVLDMVNTPGCASSMPRNS